MSELCSHEMSPAVCATCRKMEDDVVEAWRKGTPFEALYEGRCADMLCCDAIDRGGVIIRWTKDDLTAYTHEGCKP